MTCDLLETTLATTTANGDTRKETKKVIRKSSEATVGVAGFGQTQHEGGDNYLETRWKRLTLSTTVKA